MSVGDGVESWVKRILVFLGLIHPSEGRPAGGRRGRRSRYGMYASPRLDDDIDELLARLSRLENRD